jgi:CRISPR-associated endonuclease Csy4
MKVYQDITLLPTPEIGQYFLWEKVYQQIHLALVESQNEEGQVPIGIAFPEYSSNPPKLGNKLRLFAPEEKTLETLAARQWLSRLLDYVHITGIRSVPEQTKGQVIYKRLQPKANPERLARRKAKRENISLENALIALKEVKPERVKTPFVHINSQSSQRRFRLFIDKARVSQSQQGLFSTYGLSFQEATLPEF